MTALADVAQWIECWPMNQSVACLIPGQGMCLGGRPGPPVENAHEWQPHIHVSLHFSLSSPLSKNKQIKSLKKNK